MNTSTQPPVTAAAPNTRDVDRRGEEWWKEAVVYQIYPRSFADGNGDGVGDLAGLVSHLDYLAWLGVDVIWLSPVYPSPHDDNGYDISDYQDIDPLFGTLEEFDQLVAAMHAARHQAGDGPGGQPHLRRASLVRRVPQSPRQHLRDWYVWRPARGLSRTSVPNPTTGPPLRRLSLGVRRATGEYYLHLFSCKQPDLNWENPEVRQAVHSMMHWWLDRGVDGFRMDVINLISKDPALPDAHESTGGLPSTGYRDGRRISSVAPACTSSSRRCTARSSPCAPRFP